MWELASNDYSEMECVSIDNEKHEKNEINFDDLNFDVFLDDPDKDNEPGKVYNEDANVQAKIQTSHENEMQTFLLQNNKDAQRQNMKLKFINSMLRLAKKYKVTLNQTMLNQLCSQINFTDNQNNVDFLENKQLEMNKNAKRSTKNIKFSEDEDNLLKEIVEKNGAKNWRVIASMMPNRTPKQCRDRYMNYLSPNYIHTDWTITEDQLLAEKYKEIGQKWTKIQFFFPNRTANSIKNRYNYTIKLKKHI